MLELTHATSFSHASPAPLYFAGMSTLAERIEQMMEESGYRLQDIADMCGVSVQAVSQWKLGQTKNIRNEPLFRLARRSGYSPEWIATGEGPARMIAVKHPEYIIDLEPLTPDQRAIIRAVMDATQKQKTECG